MFKFHWSVKLLETGQIAVIGMRMSLLVIPFKNHLHRDTHLILPRNDTSDEAMQDNSQHGNIFDLL